MRLDKCLDGVRPSLEAPVLGGQLDLVATSGERAEHRVVVADVAGIPDGKQDAHELGISVDLICDAMRVLMPPRFGPAEAGPYEGA